MATVSLVSSSRSSIATNGSSPWAIAFRRFRKDGVERRRPCRQKLQSCGADQAVSMKIVEVQIGPGS